ncbi:hypothetical protein B0T10DRAFT_580419 [Thelonectria olida]|uniref:Uncharacterized protein n=1 Tax=Thelonectria olida TaxID=1576542 RepID=A0A9P8VWG5_9HYPO|nr:hypothetical protein B0T10DRAFT_580419 [Thelonectria olida]
MSFPTLGHGLYLSDEYKPLVRSEGEETADPTPECIPLGECCTSHSKNVSIDPYPVGSDDGHHTAHIVDSQELGGQHQTYEPNNGRETEWGPEFFPEGETPGTPTVTNSPTSYERYLSLLQTGSPEGQSGQISSTTSKPRERNSTKPSKWPRGSSYKMQKKQGKRPRIPKQNHHVAGSTTDTTSSTGMYPNKYLDSDGDLIFPTVHELCGMTGEDQEEWQRACEASK